MEMECVDLFDILPEAEVSYSTSGDFTYSTAERTKVTPALEALGYEVGSWFTGDGDSFGPLVRCVHITKDDKTVVASYG